MKLKRFFLILIIIVCVTPKELTLWIYKNNDIIRPYGNGITVSLVMLIFLVWVFLSMKITKVTKKSLNNPVVNFFLFGIISIVFPISRSLELYSIGAIKYIFYTILFILLINQLDFKNCKYALDIGFKISLLIQSLVGMLYEFFGILIPYISNYSSSIRDGLFRMTSSFAHPGDFSLYIAIIFIYFVCESFIGKNKTVLPYTILAFVDLYLSGARTMLVTSFLIGFIVLIKKYHRNWFMKLSIILVGIGGIVFFLNSEIFQNLFISNSIYDMFMARLIHWIIGFKIMFASISNFLFGVGLNFHVDYIDANYNDFSSLVSPNNAILSESFVTGMPIHNSFLIIGSELGIVGLVLYLRIFFREIKHTILILRSNSKYKKECFFIIGSLCAFMIYACQGWALMKNFGWTLFILINAFSYLLNKSATLKQS